MTPEQAETVSARFIRFLETGLPPDGLFSPEVFCDFTLPRWRLQARGLGPLLELRQRGHPGSGSVPKSRCDPTPSGFVLEVEEEWRHDGTDWYAREMFRADVVEDHIVALSVYCTGDWDRARREQHAREVQLLQP
jgi:hypothetical protein